MDRLLREGNPPVGQLASPVPQYKRPGSTDYEPVEGQHGAPFATLKDASGNIVSPATEATLEQVRALLSGVATENKLEQARALLEAISTKDFATSSKQDALNIAVEDLKSELILVKSELATIKANQLSGDQKVQLKGSIAESIATGIKAITPGSQRFYTFINPESNTTLFDSGPGEGLVLQRMFVRSDTVNRPELEFYYYDETNQPVRIAYPAGQDVTTMTIRFRPDYTNELNPFFDKPKDETGDRWLVLREPISFPNGMRVKVALNGGSNVVWFEVLR